MEDRRVVADRFGRRNGYLLFVAARRCRVTLERRAIATLGSDGSAVLIVSSVSELHRKGKQMHVGFELNADSGRFTQRADARIGQPVSVAERGGDCIS